MVERGAAYARVRVVDEHVERASAVGLLRHGLGDLGVLELGADIDVLARLDVGPDPDGELGIALDAVHVRKLIRKA